MHPGRERQVQPQDRVTEPPRRDGPARNLLLGCVLFDVFYLSEAPHWTASPALRGALRKHRSTDLICALSIARVGGGLRTSPSPVCQSISPIHREELRSPFI